MSKFSIGQTVETRDGSKARIICTDAKGGDGSYNLIALVTLPHGTEFAEWYDESSEHEGFLFSMSPIRSRLDIKIPQAK